MKSFKKLKELYEAYKLFVWLFPLIAGWGYDRIMNFWNVPTRLAADEIRFIETRKKDSAMFANHALEDAIHWNAFIRLHRRDSIHISLIEKQLKSKNR